MRTTNDQRKRSARIAAESAEYIKKGADFINALVESDEAEDHICLDKMIALLGTMHRPTL
jgi:hypothetical protein